MRRRKKTAEATGKLPDGAEARNDADHQSFANRLFAISHDFARRLPPDVRAIDHGALLYDEHGLPQAD